MVNIVSNGIDEKFLLLVQEMRNCHDEFYISGDSSYWLDFLFPSVYSLKKRNVNITCFFSQNETNDIDEIRRRDILRRLGINILFVEKFHFKAFCSRLKANIAQQCSQRHKDRYIVMHNM